MIRPASEVDFVRIGELMSLNRTEPITAVELLEYCGRFPSEGTLRYLVLDLPDTGVVAFGRAWRRPNEPAGRLNLTVATAPDFRNRGYAQRLIEALVEPEVTGLRVEVRDGDEVSLAFAKKRGFHNTAHTFESSIDLKLVDESGFDDHIRQAEAQGVRFFSFAETAMDEAALRRIYFVNEDSGLDEPGAEPTPMSFEHWRDGVSKAHWFAPRGQILAAVGDEWVGLGAVGELTPGRFYNLFTGVLTAYRGRGIAKALKALGIRYAKNQGGLTLRTNNHSANAPMLAINQRFGYVPLPGWLTFEKEISLGT